MNQFSIGNVFKGGVIGGVAAGILNLVVYVVGTLLGAKYLGDDGNGGLEVIALYRAFVMSVLFSLVGCALFAGLLKAAPAKAWTIWRVVAGLFFLSMVPGPFVVVPNDIAASVALEVMHVVGAICVVGAVAKFGRASA